MSYSKMEEVLKAINANFISPEDEIVKYNKKLLKQTIDVLTANMKNDPIFQKLYKHFHFNGSSYDNLKVGEPNEYDIDFALVLQKCETHSTLNCGCVSVIPSNKPGYFWFKVEKTYCTALNRFIKDGYMQTNLVLDWMKGILVKALNKCDWVYGHYIPSYYSESGPAKTITIEGSFGTVYIDLVPAFKFGAKFWPQQGFRENSTSIEDFYIVPKSPKNFPCGERYWRPSFRDQEADIILRKERLKPALRLLKKTRTNLIHDKICSYALKTIVLWEAEKYDHTKSLSDAFMFLLNKYRDCLEFRTIDYYWNKKNNVLDDINDDTLLNHCNEIGRCINKIDKEYNTNPTVIAEVILKKDSVDYNNFMKYWRKETRVSQFGLNSPVQTWDRLVDNEPIAREQDTLSTSGWGTAAMVTGAAAAIGLGIFAAFRAANRDRD